MTTTTHRRRTSVPLSGTLAKSQASLDSASVLAVAYAQAWLQCTGSPSVPLSGIVRRALGRYVDHLDSADPAIEVPAVARACKVLRTPDEDHTAALQRLHEATTEAGGAQPLPPFEVIKDGAYAVAERKAMHARLEALLDATGPAPQRRAPPAAGSPQRPRTADPPTDITHL